MKKRRIIYLIITILFIIIATTIIKHTNMEDNVELSKSIEIILILFLLRVSYGCTLYIRKQYQKQKYSYDIILNLGLLLFIIINIVRQINILIVNWHVLNIVDIYNHTLSSFSCFAMLTLPCIIVLSIYSIITNIILIKKEGFSTHHLLGIILGILSLLGLLGSQVIYSITSNLAIEGLKLVRKKYIDILLNISLSYLYTLIIATLYCNIRAGKHMPKYDKDYVIILGCQIAKDGTLTPLLKGRVDRAIEFAKEQEKKAKRNIIFIPTGGKGSDEKISEAKAMQNYLLEQGIAKKNILIEDKATSTIENMTFSKNIIDKQNKDANIIFATTNYHVFRSGVIANNCGMDCEGIGSKTKWYYYTNALIREFIANLVQERRKHIALLLIMYIIIGILVYIGHYYNFIY